MVYTLTNMDDKDQTFNRNHLILFHYVTKFMIKNYYNAQIHTTSHKLNNFFRKYITVVTPVSEIPKLNWQINIKTKTALSFHDIHFQ